MNNLFKLNNYLYNFRFHIPFLILWISILVFNYPLILSVWIKFGLLIYFLLIIISLFKKEKVSKEPKSIDKSKIILGYLVGINICVLFGAFSVLLFVLLRNLKNKE